MHAVKLLQCKIKGKSQMLKHFISAVTTNRSTDNTVIDICKVEMTKILAECLQQTHIYPPGSHIYAPALLPRSEVLTIFYLSCCNSYFDHVAG